MERGCTPSIKTSIFINILVVLMLLSQTRSTGIYSCWGGCLSDCLRGAGKNGEATIPCYWDCSTKCFPRSDQSSTTPPSPSPSDQTSKLHSSPASEFPVPSPSNDTNTPVNSKSKHKKYYCIIGCSLQNCLKPSNAGTDLKTCLVMCNHKCK